MSDQLQLRSPQDRVITEYLCDDASIADCAAQLQQTGDETLELHRFVMSIIDGQISVQDGISIEALQDMALTLGDGLGPLGDYFCNLATATWTYAEACRLAGDATKHLFEWQSNLSNSLATLVDERGMLEGLASSTRNLPDDGLASGYMVMYVGLREDGGLDNLASAVSLDGMTKDVATQKIEGRQAAIQTLHDAVHDRQDEHLSAWDSAVDDWEAGAETFVAALDGILGVLADTSAEDDYQQLGSVGAVAGAIATVADVITFIPLPPLQAVAVVVGVLATSIEVAANGGQALKARFQPGDDSIRVVEGQVVGEGEEAGKVAASGFVPVGDVVGDLLRLTKKERKVLDAVETGDGIAKDAAEVATQPGEGSRAPAPAVDVGVSTDPIAQWQEEADATNPDGAYGAGQAMPTAEERAADIPGYVPPVQIPTADEPAATGSQEPTGIEVTAPDSRPTQVRPRDDDSTVRTGDRTSPTSG